MKRIAALLFLLSVGACAHQVTFEAPEPYAIGVARQNAGVTAVIDRETLERRVPIQSFMTGIANTWEAQPGDMLKQVADMELPQMFTAYDYAPAYKEPAAAGNWLVLALSIPSYEFSDFRAKVSVHAVVYERGQKELIRKTYAAEGESQGGKMFWAGAFGMKSAIRQSSFDAYKRIFADLRGDLQTLLAAQTTPVK
jgi:hypothetical protein